MSEPCDPVCLIHGLKHSEHNCLFCGLCFEPLTPDQCAFLPDGTKEDVCVPCAMAEHRRLPLEFYKLHRQIEALRDKLTPPKSPPSMSQ